MWTCKTAKESAPPPNDEPIQAMLNTRNRAKSSRLSISMKCYDNISNQVYATYVRSKLAPFAYIVHINFKYWTTPPNMCMWPNCRYTTFSFKVMTIIIHRHKWRLQSWFNPKTLTHASQKRFSIQLFFSLLLLEFVVVVKFYINDSLIQLMWKIESKPKSKQISWV